MAMAIQAAARAAGVPIERIEVLADEAAAVWIVRVRVASRERRMTFPFASARGIYTPAEVAAHVLSERWPFG
jgi:hypothetical protein